MKCQSLLSGKIRKNTISLSSDELAKSEEKVKSKVKVKKITQDWVELFQKQYFTISGQIRIVTSYDYLVIMLILFYPMRNLSSR